MLAHAHGGLAGPNEVGPPIMTSIALAFVCYWVVILWPASKRGDGTADGTANGSPTRNGGDRTRTRTMPKSGVAKNRARLGNAGFNGRIAEESDGRRKASDA